MIRPSTAAAIVGAVFLTLIGLGVWQLHRGQEKQKLIEAAELGLAAPPLATTKAPGADKVWTRAVARGRWAPNSVVRIQSRTLNGRVGVDFAAPLVLADGGVLVALLGWAPVGASTPALPGGGIEVEGALRPGRRPSRFMPDNIPPTQWLWLEPAAIAAAAGLDPNATSPLALSLTAPPGGLTARPARPTFIHNHLQYALTWFGLAAALAGIIIVVKINSRRQP